MIRKYAVIAHGPDEDKLRLALSAAVLLAKEHKVSISIVVPTLKNAANTILKKIVGEKYVKALLKGKSATLEEVPVALSSIKTFHPRSESGVVVGLWGGEKMLAVLDQATLAIAIVAISWNKTDMSDWINSDDAKVIGDGA